MNRRFLLGLLFAFSTGMSVASAGMPPASLKLNQARLIMPALLAYVDVRDANGKQMVDFSTGQFSASLGERTLPVEQIQPFDKAGEGVAYIFLVDMSRTVKSGQFAKIRSALSAWADTLTGQDRMAVLGFGETVRQVSDFTADKASLKLKIHDLKPLDQHTALHQGLIQAMQMGRRANADLPGRRVIIVLSNGRDDLPGGPTQNEVLRQMEVDRVPIYAMGLEKLPVNGKHEDAIETLGLFAHISGGEYVGVGKLPLAKVTAGLREKINAVAMVRLDCKLCPTDGLIQRLQITLQDGGLALSDGVDMRALPPLPRKSKPESNPVGEVNPVPPAKAQNLAYIGLALAGLLLAVALVLALRRKPSGKRRLTPMVDGDGGKSGWSDKLPTLAKAGSSPSRVTQQPHARLVRLGGGGHGNTYELTISSEAVIGRKAECEVAIPGDTEISTRHCALLRKGKSIFLHDLGSTNGTRVNGVPITSDYRLQEGDIIGIGRTELRVFIFYNTFANQHE